jgi:hypothetical protein
VVKVLKHLFVLLILVSHTTVFALDDDTFQRLQTKKNSYNQQVDSVPRIIITLFGNERINVYLTGCSSDCEIGLVTSDGRAVELRKGEISDPTMRVWMEESLLERILDSHDARGDFITALNNGDIKVEGVGILKKIKLTLVKLVARILL